ncbi:MAG: hypothetical protein WAM14_19125, partial [Candidatus Nitrosopolaris sp.]
CVLETWVCRYEGRRSRSDRRKQVWALFGIQQQRRNFCREPQALSVRCQRSTKRATWVAKHQKVSQEVLRE